VTVRIAHLSDIHFGGELTEAAQASLRSVADFDPIVVAVTGDLTLNGLPREFRAARDWLAQLGPAVVVTPGNHDTPYWNLPLRAIRPFGRYRRYIGASDGAAFDTPQVSVRALNSARGAQPRLDWSKGALDLGQLNRIAWSAGVRVFACHHPLVDLAGAPVSGGVRCGALAAAALSEAGVELVLTGHVHVPFALPLSGGSHTCYAIGAGTLSRRLRGAPASFSTIEISDEAFDVTVQAWTGARFETGEQWRLARSMAAAGGLAIPGPFH
jgi:3',5'-cyclic AMP phosphodiesterase CpdA